MGMGLPTVAAYVIGAVLYAPALQKLGVPQLTSHFFVMYYCVLSMVTPPVALAAYAAAGLARTSPWNAGWYAFQMSFVAFLIPFAFVADPSLLFAGTHPQRRHRVASVCSCRRRYGRSVWSAISGATWAGRIASC